MFKEDHANYVFHWEDLGNIEEGRPNLGPTTLVGVYRLMQYTMRSVLIREYGPQAASRILFKAGKLAGSELCKNVLDTKLGFNDFISDLQGKLKSMRIGILRVEKADLEKMQFVLTVDEDLDCSGLPFVGETVCDYDEGFIAGVLDTYTGKQFDVREIDCWASGERTCRFSVILKS